jgi:hypothetical protein
MGGSRLGRTPACPGVPSCRRPPPTALRPPQHDTLFDKLTVREHLELFAGIKGMSPGSATSATIEAFINDVGLQEKVRSCVRGGLPVRFLVLRVCAVVCRFGVNRWSPSRLPRCPGMWVLQANSNAGELSGGQKRRLSVAMALIGNPKVVYLDEVRACIRPLEAAGAVCAKPPCVSRAAPQEMTLLNSLDDCSPRLFLLTAAHERP